MMSKKGWEISQNPNKKLKIVTIFVPNLYLNSIEKLIQLGYYNSRCSLIRDAINTKIKQERKDLKIFEDKEEVIKNEKRERRGKNNKS